MHGLWLIIAVQIAIESLPISSSSHMKLAELFFSQTGAALSLLPEYFDHLLHGPTVLVVMLFFFKDWFSLVILFFRSLFFKCKRGYTRASSRRLFIIFWQLVGLVAVCSILPAIVMYGIVKPYLVHTAYADSLYVLLIGLPVTMGMLLSLRFLPDRFKPNVNLPETLGAQELSRANRPLKYTSVFVLGVVQALCLLIHGMSRFACTYSAARWLGFNNRRAFQVSFLIELPLIFVAFLFNGVRDLLATPGWQLLFTWDVNCALFGATVLAYLFLWFAWYLGTREHMWWFGVYMIVPIGLVIWKLI